MVLDNLAELVRITASATQRFPQERNASLVLDDQLQHDLIQIGPMIPAVALGDVHNLGVRGRIAVLATITMKARTVEMGKAGRKAQTLGGRRRYETVEFRYPVVLEGIQGTSEGIIVELCGGNAGRNEDSLVICVTRVFSHISLIFKRIVNIPRGQAGYVGTGDLDSKYRSSAA